MGRVKRAAPAFAHIRTLLPVLVLAVLAAGAGKPELVCVDAAEAGLKGSPPFVGAYVVHDGIEIPAQVYVNGTVIKTVGIWEANSTKPTVQNVTVLPRELHGLVCFQPGEPAPAKVRRGKYIEVEAKGRRYGVTLVDVREEAKAPPPLPIPDGVELVKGRVVAKRDVVEQGLAATATAVLGVYAQLQQPSQSLFRDFSGTIVAAFKLRQTDGYVISSQTARGSCATGRFILPNGTSYFYLVFTPATRAEIYGGASELWLYITGAVYNTGGQRLGDLKLSGAYYGNTYRIPNNPSPWHALYADLSQWTGIDKEIRIQICNDQPIYGRYIIDAFIYTTVPAKSYAEPFALESPGQGTAVHSYGAWQLYNGTYLAIPGFTTPLGYALGSAKASITVRTCARNPPSSVNIYWGPFYIGSVSRTQGTDGCWYYVATPAMFTGAWDVAARAGLYVGGALHAIYIGPFNADAYNSGIYIQQLRVEGLYRPEMNARVSRIFRDKGVYWGYYTLSGFGAIYDPYAGGYYTYGSKIDIKFFRSGDLYYNPHVLISISKYDGMTFHCSPIEIYVSAYSNGKKVWLGVDGVPAALKESGQGAPKDFIDALVELISNVFEETNKWASRVLKVISWGSFAIDLLVSASEVSVSAKKVDDYTVQYIIDIGPLAPSAIAVDGATLIPNISPDAVVYSIERVSVQCVGVYTYSPYSFYVDPLPRLISTQGVHVFRTFTCGKQEIGDPYPNMCTSSLYG